MRGIMFTTMLTFMSLVVLSLSVVYVVYMSSVNTHTDRLIMYRQANEIITSIEKGFTKILSINGFLVDVRNNTATVNYTMVNPIDLAWFRASLLNNLSYFNTFIVNNTDYSVNFSSEKLILNPPQLNLRFMPENTTFSSLDGIGGNGIEVANTTHVIAYDVFIYAEENGVMYEGPNSNPVIGDYDPVVLNIWGETLNNDMTRYTETLRGDMNSSINISVAGTHYFVVNISSMSGDNKVLRISRNGEPGFSMVSVTTVFNATLQPTVVLAEESINMTIKQYNIKKIGEIRVG